MPRVSAAARLDRSSYICTKSAGRYSTASISHVVPAVTCKELRADGVVTSSAEIRARGEQARPIQ